MDEVILGASLYRAILEYDSWYEDAVCGDNAAFIFGCFPPAPNRDFSSPGAGFPPVPSVDYPSVLSAGFPPAPSKDFPAPGAGFPPAPSAGFPPAPSRDFSSPGAGFPPAPDVDYTSVLRAGFPPVPSADYTSVLRAGFPPEFGIMMDSAPGPDYPSAPPGEPALSRCFYCVYLEECIKISAKIRAMIRAKKSRQAQYSYS